MAGRSSIVAGQKGATNSPSATSVRSRTGFNPPLRFTLSKSEILRGYKSFTRVITSGDSISAPPLRCHFSCTGSIPGRILVGFSVSRSFKRAIDRNKAKRLMRESYRLSKPQLKSWAVLKKQSLDIVFIYLGSRTTPVAVGSFDAVYAAMRRLFTTISTREEDSQ